MACLCKKFNKKKVLFSLGGIIGIGILAFGIKNVTYEMKVSTLKKTHSIKFDDIKKDYDKDTGLINSEVEKKLNKAGIFDFEIMRLDEEDIKGLKECKNIEEVIVDKEFYGINNDNRRFYEGYEYGFSLEEVSGKEVLVRDRDFYSLASIVYSIKNDKVKNKDEDEDEDDDKKTKVKSKNNKDNKYEEYNNVYKTISICTFYNMPSKLGHDMFELETDPRAIKKLNTTRAYGVYDVTTYKDISATKVKKKESNIDVHINNLTSRIIEEDSYKGAVFFTDRLFKYQDLEKIDDWKTTYVDLRRKEIDFIKANNASFIISVEQEIKDEWKVNLVGYNIRHFHQVINTNKMYDIPSTQKQISKMYNIMDENNIYNQWYSYEEDEEYEDEYIDDEIDWDEKWDDIKSEELYYLD